MKKYYLFAILSFSFLATACHHTSTGGQYNNQSTSFFDSFPSMTSDESLKNSVLETFMQHPELTSLPIQVETKKGTVYLSGYVKTIRQSDTAGDVALKVPGVRALHNGLIVRK